MVASVDAPEKMVGKAIKRREDPRLDSRGRAVHRRPAPAWNVAYRAGALAVRPRKDQEHRSGSGAGDARRGRRLYGRRLHGSQSAARGLAGGRRQEQRRYPAGAGRNEVHLAGTQLPWSWPRTNIWHATPPRQSWSSMKHCRWSSTPKRQRKRVLPNFTRKRRTISCSSGRAARSSTRSTRHWPMPTSTPNCTSSTSGCFRPDRTAWFDRRYDPGNG